MCSHWNIVYLTLQLSSVGAHDNAQQEQLRCSLDRKVDIIPFISHDTVKHILAGHCEHCRKCTW
jgi:hypothetical protein